MVAFIIKIGPEIASEAFWIRLASLIPIPGFDLLWMRDMLYEQDPRAFDMLAHPEQFGAAWGLTFFNLTNLVLPFLMAVPVLYIVFWRKLMRVREFYADARTAQWLQSIAPIREALIAYGDMRHLQTTATPPKRWLGLPVRPFAFASRRGLLSYHPTTRERLDALKNPLSIFGQPRQIAFWTGMAVLLLEFILRSNLTLIYISQPGPYLPLLTALIVFGLWLLPRVCQGIALARLARMALQMTVIFILVKLTLNFLDAIVLILAALFGRLDALAALLDLYLRSYFGISGVEIGTMFGNGFGWQEFVQIHVIGPILYYLLFGVPFLTLALIAAARLQQQALLWYAGDDRVRRALLLVLGFAALFSVLTVIPLANMLFFPTIYDPSWRTAMSMMLGLLLLLGFAAGYFWIRKHWLRCCPACQRMIPGPFHLGKTCPHCRQTLHPWLIA